MNQEIIQNINLLYVTSAVGIIGGVLGFYSFIDNYIPHKSAIFSSRS